MKLITLSNAFITAALDNLIIIYSLIMVVF